MRARQSDPSILMEARSLLEYREVKEGYWTCDKFIVQMKKEKRLQVGGMFGYLTTVAAAMAEDSVNPGGRQRVMRNFAIGVPKDLRIVLQECGVDTTNMNADQIREVLKQHPDFSDKKCRTERLLVEEHNHLAYFLHKYHCELRKDEVPSPSQHRC